MLSHRGALRIGVGSVFLLGVAWSGSPAWGAQGGIRTVEHPVNCPLSASAGIGETSPADASRQAGGPFAASGVTLRSWVPFGDFPNNQYLGNDIWGYVSPSGRQYAIMGLSKGAGFVEVTDPDNPVVVGYVDGAGIDSIWRDMKTYQEYVYIVTESTGVGLQVADLSGIDGGTVTLVNTSTQDGFATAHNVLVNPDSGFAYLVGANQPSGGIVAVDLADPVNPNIVGAWSDQVVHDAVAVSYTAGPFAGREIVYAFCGGAGLFVVDVTDKGNMFTVASMVYPNLSYCHQGWLSEDRRHLFIGDEADESDVGISTTTYVANVEDPGNPTYVTSFTNGLPSIDHNMMVRGNYLYEANYSSGLRVWDVSDVNNASEVGYFDTYPEDTDVNFSGAWGSYAGFPNSIVLISDRNRGLFVLDAGGPPIPAVSEWGAAVMVLLVLAAGTVAFRRRRAAD